MNDNQMKVDFPCMSYQINNCLVVYSINLLASSTEGLLSLVWEDHRLYIDFWSKIIYRLVRDQDNVSYLRRLV